MAHICGELPNFIISQIYLKTSKNAKRSYFSKFSETAEEFYCVRVNILYLLFTEVDFFNEGIARNEFFEKIEHLFKFK